MCCHHEHVVTCIKYRQSDEHFVYYCLPTMNWQRGLSDTDVYVSN